MKTTLNIADQLLRNARKRAARDGISLTKLVEDALKAKLLQDEQAVTYDFKPLIVTGSKPPNVDIAERDSLFAVIDNA